MGNPYNIIDIQTLIKSWSFASVTSKVTFWLISTWFYLFLHCLSCTAWLFKNWMSRYFTLQGPILIDWTFSQVVKLQMKSSRCFAKTTNTTLTVQFLESYPELSDPPVSLPQWVCCNSQCKLFHNCSDHSSFPVSEYDCLWPCVSCVKAGGSPGQQFLHWPSRWSSPCL